MIFCQDILATLIGSEHGNIIRSYAVHVSWKEKGKCIVWRAN